jgi:hypothetical protein
MTEQLTWIPCELFPSGYVAEAVAPFWLRIWEYSDEYFTMIYQNPPPSGPSLDGPKFASLESATYHGG